MKMKKESNFGNKLLIMFCSLLVMVSGIWYSGYKKEYDIQMEEESYEMVFKELSEEAQKPLEDAPEKPLDLKDQAETGKTGTDVNPEEVPDAEEAPEADEKHRTEGEALEDAPITQPDVTEQGKININTATAAELTALPGIGEVLAGRIVEYRKQQGAFQSLEDIKNVDGIGEKKFEAIKGSISI